MNVTKFSDEAKRLNVSLEFVEQAFEKAIREGKIYGVIDTKNPEIIRFKLDEIDALVGKLDFGRISLNNLAADLNLKVGQVRLVLEYVLNEKRVNGVLASDGTFLSDKTLKELVLEIVQKNGGVDVNEISNQLFVPEKEISTAFENFYNQILAAIAPYQQIKIEDLSAEVGLSKNVLLALLKKLILEGEISGRLDMVRNVLVLGKSAIKSPEFSESNDDDEIMQSNNVLATDTKHKPSDAWYLVAFLLGLIGGLLGYLVVKDDDKEMADNLLALGVIMTIIYLIVVWASYGWLISRII